MYIIAGLKRRGAMEPWIDRDMAAEKNKFGARDRNKWVDEDILASLFKQRKVKGERGHFFDFTSSIITVKDVFFN